jgi:CubicO group peptidase (beta-lactamase class C family)
LASKQFAGFAVALLERADRLALSDDVRSYVPELLDYGRAITVVASGNSPHPAGLVWPNLEVDLSGKTPKNEPTAAQAAGQLASRPLGG